MSDLCFSKDTGMQDGTGDPLYMNFLHKYVSSIGVGYTSLSRTQVSLIGSIGGRLPTQSVSVIALFSRNGRRESFP